LSRNTGKLKVKNSEKAFKLFGKLRDIQIVKLESNQQTSDNELIEAFNKEIESLVEVYRNLIPPNLKREQDVTTI